MAGRGWTIDDAPRLDGETGGRDLWELVVSGLARSGDAEVGEGAGHGPDSSGKGVRNLPYVRKPE